MSPLVIPLIQGAVEIIKNRNNAREENKASKTTKAALPVAASSGAGVYVALDGLPEDQRVVVSAAISLLSYLGMYLYRKAK